MKYWVLIYKHQNRGYCLEERETNKVGSKIVQHLPQCPAWGYFADTEQGDGVKCE
jgi:hypothetical protein